MEKRKKQKWMRGLTVNMIKEITDEKAIIKFNAKMPKVVMCVIHKNNENAIGIGYAICSTLDKQKFSMKKGKRIAAEQALLALKLKKSTGRIRTKWKQFPRSWKKSQVKRVINISKFVAFKSRYAPSRNIESFIPYTTNRFAEYF